jgi:hypothetical protein
MRTESAGIQKGWYSLLSIRAFLAGVGDPTSAVAIVSPKFRLALGAEPVNVERVLQVFDNRTAYEEVGMTRYLEPCTADRSLGFTIFVSAA